MNKDNKNFKQEEEEVLEGDFTEVKDEKHECHCHDGGVCDCGDDCKCGDDCDCDECGDICDCDECGDDCSCGDEKETKHDLSHKKSLFKDISVGRLIFGLVIFSLGVFYLGRTLSWWNFDLNWTVIWPFLIIILGLSIIGGHKIVKWLLWLFFFAVIAVLIFTVVFLYQDRQIENFVPENKILSNEVLLNSENMINVNNNEEIKVQMNRYFSGVYSRSEVEEKIDEVLDNVYMDNNDEKIEIGVEIRKK